jgi:hypothetical protein
MSNKNREIFRHVDRHDVNRVVAVSEVDGDFNFRVAGAIVGSLAFRTPSRDEGVTPESVLAAVEDHLLSFDPSRGETDKAVALLVEARRHLANGRDLAAIVKRERAGSEPVVASAPVAPVKVQDSPVPVAPKSEPNPYAEKKPQAKPNKNKDK